MKGHKSSSSDSDSAWRDQVLSEKDSNHRVYLCEYGLIHLDWNEHRLVYCPGDFVGLPFMLSSLDSTCDLECIQGEACPRDHGDGMVHLQYGSVQIPFSREECQELHILVREAVGRLFDLRRAGYFANQRWQIRDVAEMKNHQEKDLRSTRERSLPKTWRR
jgi:hypothetical protein